MANRLNVAAWLVGSAAFALASAPAQAQETATSFQSYGWAKKEAILRAPSALQAILAQQQGLPAQTATLQPANYSRPALVPAIIQEAREPSAAVTSGKPDVFGSVALRVGYTPLKARWLKVEHASVGGSAAHFADSLAELDEVSQLEAVNRYVNRRVNFVDDERQFGRADVWTSANQTLSTGKGDCEDYAIAKLQLLRRAGFASRNLYLVIVKDLVSRADHAVLVVRAAGRMYVLDNGTEELLDSESLRDYRPILTFASYGTWTHGYRVRSQPVQIASAETALDEPITPGSADQRSRSASLLAFNTGFSK